MSNFNEVVKYLRYTRRSDEARDKSTRRSASLIDFNYDPNAIPHEEDLIFVEKAKIDDFFYFAPISEMTSYDTSILYLKTSSSGKLEYYVKVQDTSSTEAQYKKLSGSITQIVTLANDIFTPVATDKDALYDRDKEHFIVLLGEEVFVNEDIFTYHPDDIPLSNGTYSFDFEENTGYIANALNYTSTVSALLSAQKKRVTLTKSDKAQKVNIFPRIKIKDQGYFLEYTGYQRGIQYYSFMNEPVITLRFNYYGALLSFLNSTLFYYFDNQKEDGFLESRKEIKPHIGPGPLTVETSKKKLFAEDYQRVVRDLLDKRKIDPLIVAFYLPQYFFTNKDIDFLWDLVAGALKTTTTNAITKNEDTVINLIKILATFYKEDYGQFLEELSTRTIKSSRNIRRSGRKHTITKNTTLIERLIANIDNGNFTNLMLFLISLWVHSVFKKDAEKRKHIKNAKGTVINPVFCGYTSGKSWSFFHENTNFDWTKDGHLALEVTSEEGVKNYKYHPMDLIAISNAENESLTFTGQRLDIISVLPAFALYAHSDTTFWKNVGTAAEYVGDLISIATGLGPAWRAFRILSAVTKATGAAQKIFVITRSAVGVMEVVAGTGNILLKSTQYIDDPLGKKIGRVLMWMEIASLGTEVVVGIAKRLSSSAEIALKEADLVLKTNMEGHWLSRAELKQVGHSMLGQLEGARYLVSKEFKGVAGPLAQSFKDAGIQVLEITEEFLKSLEKLGNDLLDELGFPRPDSTQFEFVLANSNGPFYFANLNGKSFFAMDTNQLKGFFSSMSDHLSSNSKRIRIAGKRFNRIDAAFDLASEIIAYNRVKNGDNIDIIHNGKVIATIKNKEDAEEFLKNIYKNNQKLLKEIHLDLNKRYSKWLEDNNLELSIVPCRNQSTKLKIIDKTTKDVVYTGLPDRVHSYLIAEQLSDAQRQDLILRAYKIAQKSPQKFNLKLANESIFKEYGFTIKRSRLGSSTVPTFRVLGRKMFLRTGKLGNGRYDKIIKAGYSLDEINDAVQKIIKNRGVATKIKLTGNRTDDFNLVWDSWGIPRGLGKKLYDNLDITFHHMDDVNLNYKGTFELVHSDLHRMTFTHTGNFGIFEIMLDLIK